MKKLSSIKEKLTPECLRFVVYTLFSRVIYGITAALLLDFFIKNRPVSVKQIAFSVFAVLAAAGAWMNYLRLDGMNLPKNLHLTLPKKKRPVISYGDMSDHLDDEPPKFEDLEQGEQDACKLVSDLILLVIFVAFSLLWK